MTNGKGTQVTTNNALGWGRYAVGMYMSSKKPIVTDISCQEAPLGFENGNVRLIPSSSDDLTFATITSDVKGRNTTSLKTTAP